MLVSFVHAVHNINIINAQLYNIRVVRAFTVQLWISLIILLYYLIDGGVNRARTTMISRHEPDNFERISHHRR